MTRAANGILVWLSVSDLQKACEFYSELLGLKLSHLDEVIGWAEFVHPKSNALVGLRQCEKEEIIPAGGATLVFDVSELEKAMAELEKNGVPFLTGAMNLNGYRFATFIDPDGNQLQLREVTKKS